jgi:hypothetical protein
LTVVKEPGERLWRSWRVEVRKAETEEGCHAAGDQVSQGLRSVSPGVTLAFSIPGYRIVSISSHYTPAETPTHTLWQPKIPSHVYKNSSGTIWLANKYMRKCCPGNTNQNYNEVLSHPS